MLYSVKTKTPLEALNISDMLKILELNYEY